MKAKATTFIVLFLSPFLVFYTVFVTLPLFYSFYLSLTQWDGVGRQIFIGLANFGTLFQLNDYWISFRNTVVMVGLCTGIQIPLGLILSYLLYRSRRGRLAFRTIYFLPVVISQIAIGLMFFLVYNSEMGILNAALKALGLASWQRQWLSDPKVLLYMVILPMVWQYIGLYVIIFMAALESMPEEILESAVVDGANSVQQFFRIVLPTIREVIQIGIILCVTGSLKAFGHAWIMTQGGPGFRSAYLTIFMYRTAFQNRHFGLGSSVAITILAVSLIFTVLFRKYVSKSDEEWTERRAAVRNGVLRRSEKTAKSEAAV